MAFLILRKDEIEVLSLINGKKINSFSVLNGMEGFNKESFEKKKNIHTSIINDFAKDGAIWKDQAGKPHLIRELQGVFDMINAPERTIKIKTASQQPLEEHYYCTIGKIGVLFSVGKGGEFYTLAYTLNDELLSKWFSDELVGDLGVKEKKAMHLESTLSQEEFEILTLLFVHNTYLKLNNKQENMQ